MKLLACVCLTLVICHASASFIGYEKEEKYFDRVLGNKDCADCKGFMNDISTYIMSDKVKDRVINEYMDDYCRPIQNAAVYRYCTLVVESIVIKLMQSFVDNFASEYTCIVLTFCPPPPPPQVDY